MSAPGPRQPSRRAFLGAAGLLGAVALGACSPAEPDPPPTTTSRPPPTRDPATWRSTLVGVHDGRLSYRDVDGLRVPDFGDAGYRAGRAPVPEVARSLRVTPTDGDCTDLLQRAIDEVGALPRGDDGMRGAVVLDPGTYVVAGTIRLQRSGVVLRGAGDGDDPATSTVLRAVGDRPRGRDVLVLGDDSGFAQAPGPRTDVTDAVVPVAATSVTVADPEGLRPGTPVVVVHPCTRAWLRAVDHGGTGRRERWQPDELPIEYFRRVTEVRGREVTLDAPVFTVLDRSLSTSRLVAWDRTGLVTDVGVEDLRVDIAAEGPEDERHARNGIALRGVEDAWVRRCTVLHFTQAGVLTRGARRVTVAGCRTLEPAARVTGGRRYNVNAADRSQLVLVTACHAEGARHAYVANGTSTVSGVVFHRTTASGSLAASEGHRRWSQGLLYDGHREIDPMTDRTLALYNRGDYGTGHGWSAVHSVAWACDVGDTRLVVQRPPTAQNYAVGCTGDVTSDGPFDGPPGHVEGTGRPGLDPPSLYEAQVADG